MVSDADLVGTNLLIAKEDLKVGNTTDLAKEVIDSAMG